MRELWLRIAALLVAGALGALLADPAARAEPGPTPVRLSVDCALVDCPGVEALRSRLVALLGSDPVRDDAGRAVRVRYAPGDPGVVTEISLRIAGSPVGRRRFSTAVDDWDAVLDAAAMNIAMVVDPGRALLGAPSPAASMAASPPEEPPGVSSPAEPSPAEPSPTEPSPAEPSPTEPSPTEPPPTEPSPAAPPLTEPPRSDRVELSAAAGASGGLSPGVSATLRAAVALAGPQAAAELALRFDAPSAADFAGGQVTGAVLAADLAGCLRWGALAGCATGLIGAQRASSTGLPAGRSVTVPIAAFGLRARLSWPVAERGFLRLDLDGRAPLSRTRLRVGGNIAWQSAPFMGGATLGGGWLF